MVETQQNYEHLASRAHLFLEKKGGRCAEETLITEVFGVRGKPEIWGAILRQVLRDSTRFRRLPNGEWVLNAFTNEQARLSDLEYVVIDTETTGLHPQRNRIIEIAAIKLRCGKRVETFETLINPHRRLPGYITELTQINQQMVSSAPDFSKIIDHLLDFMRGCIIVGHNVAFDIRFLDGELRKLGRPPVLNETIDTIRLATRLNPGFRRPNLDRLAALLNLPVTTRHRAFADASLTSDALMMLLRQAERQGYVTLADLRSGRPSSVPVSNTSTQLQLEVEKVETASSRFHIPAFDAFVNDEEAAQHYANHDEGSLSDASPLDQQVAEPESNIEGQAEEQTSSSRPAKIRRQRTRSNNDGLLSLTDRATGRARHRLSKDLLKDLPDKPGVYLMKDAEGKVIYVGKAKNLYNRVSSYYSEPLGYTRKIDGLTENIAKIEHIATGSELEALLLESKLIKHYLPKYNKQLRNYENYPFIKIDLSQRFPRVYSVREITDDGGRYFGPFKSRKAVDATVEIIQQVFPVRTCTRSFEIEFLSRQKNVRPPCLRHELGRCPGPCVKGQAGDAENAAYTQIIEDVVRFLSGEKETMLDMLWERMNKASHNQDYEKARQLRDAIQQVERIVSNQTILAAAIEGNNLLIYLPSASPNAIELLCVFRGRLGRQIRLETSTSPTELALQLAQIWQELETRELELNRQHSTGSKRGGRVVLQEEVDEINIISRWVYSNSGSSSIFRVSDNLTSETDFWKHAATQILSAPLVKIVENDTGEQTQFDSDL